jgi:hypothetical protein
MTARRADAVALAFCLLFVVLGSLWISEVGIQTDEALFSAGIYPPFGESVRLFGAPFPLMVMSYVGTLKSYVWWPILSVWEPSAASLRFPAVVLAAWTVWLFYVLLKRTVSVRAAVVGTALLALDPVFLLTSRWDWGPVVLQHLCLVGGMLAFVRFVQEGQTRWLAVGAFVFGLGMWDKAIFSWSLVGLGVAAALVFPRSVMHHLRVTAIATAIFAFVAGAFPLVLYNFRNEFATFRQNSRFSLEENVAGKALVLRAVADGSGLLGSIPRETGDGPVRNPDSAFKRLWIGVTEWLGMRRSNFSLELAVLAIVLLPLAWRSPARPAFLFAAIYVPVTWTQMALLSGGGGGAHHPILMWPLPHIAVAAVLAEASRRFGSPGALALAACVGVACLSSVAVIGTYYTNMLRNGAAVEWSDAIYPASRALPELEPSYVCALDWGFWDSLRFLHRGRVGLCNAVDPQQDAETAKRQVADPAIVYIAHVKGAEMLPAGLTERFVAFAEAEGYRKRNQRTFHDYNGRPIIEIFKLFRSQPAQ